MKASISRAMAIVAMIIAILSVDCHAQSLDTLKVKDGVDSLIAVGDSSHKVFQFTEALEIYQTALPMAQEVARLAVKQRDF